MEADLEETVRLTILQHEVRPCLCGEHEVMIRFVRLFLGGERHLRATIVLQAGAVLGRVAQ